MAKKRREVRINITIEENDQRLFDVPNIDYENRNGRVWVGGNTVAINAPKGMLFQAVHEDGQLRIIGEDWDGIYILQGATLTIIYEEDAS